MDIRRCNGCMEPLEGENCPHCDYSSTERNAPHQLPAGFLLQGRFLVGKVLSVLGRQIQYIGWDLERNQKVVIKEFYQWENCMRDSSNSPVVTAKDAPLFLERMEVFLRDAKTLSQLDTAAQFVTVQDVFEENQTAYAIQAYVPGVTLAQYISDMGGTLTKDETLQIMEPIMKALQPVHGAGMVNRYINPNHIIVDTEGSARLLETDAIFPGRYKHIDDLPVREKDTELSFMAIEQLTVRGKMSAATDVYAVCAVIYFCLTGSLPRNVIRCLEESSEQDWAGVQGISPVFCSAMKKGMEIRAINRIASMEALMDALNEETLPLPYAAKKGFLHKIRDLFGNGESQ